ncbi:MAG: pitrilysin family protein [Tepidisphaeraceae bacterium]
MSVGGARFLAALVALLCYPVIAAAQEPATQPAAELLQSTSSMPGYGAEAYRIVSGADEIVAVLKNGATVICQRVASPVASVRGYACTGGVYEGRWLGGGLSHLLEHLVAGGSSQRRSEAENRALLQEIGNDSNAYTSYDHTAFFVNTTAQHFAQAVDLVTGWMLGARITQAEYLREHQVVQRELERNKGDPDRVFWLLTQRNRYQVSPAGVPVIGYQEVIQGLSRDDVYSYYQEAYQPNNMVFSVAADLDPEQMLAVVQRNLADAAPGRVFGRNIADEPPVPAPRTVVATFPKLGQARLDLTFPSVKQSDPSMYALDLLAQILGGGESSILVEDLRDRQQLCSGISCVDDTPPYVEGSFHVQLQLDAQKISAATKAVLADVEKIKSNGVDEDRLQRAKTRMRVDRLRSMQKSEDVAASAALDFMSTGDVHFSDHYVQRIGQLTAQDVQAAARRYLDSGKLLTTALLPREAVGAAGWPKAEDLLGASPATQPAAQQGASSEITRRVLGNGLVVLHQRITTAPLVAINMYALGGMTAEDAKTNGLGNLAMMLPRRGTDTRSAEQIADFFDRTGGELTTACGNNTWYWTVSCTADQFEPTMEVYGDLVNHPVFAAAQVEQMKTRVLAEIEGKDAAWDRQAFRYFNKQFFGPRQSPYQFEAVGTERNLAAFSPADARMWYTDKILTAPRVLAIFGDVDADTAFAAAEKCFGQTPKLPAPAPAAAPPEPSASVASPGIDVQRVEVQKTDQDVAAVVVGFASDSVIGEPDESALIVSQCLTGGYGYPTGYIFEILRGRGLVYEAGTFNFPGRAASLPGVFAAYAACDPKNVDQVIDVILENVARLQGTEQDIQPQWFDRCKDVITTTEALQTQTPQEQASLAAVDELLGVGYNHPAGFAQRISAVKLPMIQALSRSRLRRCVVTICTPAPQLVKTAAGGRTYSTFPPVDLTPRGVQHDVGHK